MIDFSVLENYRENNRIEAKKALGGLPHSIWETYSAFANTLGGLILLGVEEYKDKTLHTVDLPAPEEMVHEFWSKVNDPRFASVNILSAGDVAIHEVAGDHIIVISVPRAERTDKPVFVEGDRNTGTYRRSGEGDCRCSRDEIQTMLRDAARRTQDMRVLDDLPPEILDMESLHGFRALVGAARPGHRLLSLSDADFLAEVNALAPGVDGTLCPTAAGLLMFGSVDAIRRAYPHCELLLIEEEPSGARSVTIRASERGQSGNLFGFYAAAYARILAHVSLPSDADAQETPLHQALREALANCLVNADYYSKSPVTVLLRPQRISFSNPGMFRVPLQNARDQGVSDPRNAVLHRLFNLIDPGEHGGSGIPLILRTWRALGFSEPVFAQRMDPDRSVLSLPLIDADPARPSKAARTTVSGVAGRDIVIQFLTDQAFADAEEVALETGLSVPDTEELLKNLIDEDLVVAEIEDFGTLYRLRA